MKLVVYEVTVLIIKTWELDKSKVPLKLHYTEDLSHLTKEIDQIKGIKPVEVTALADKTADIYILKGQVQTILTLQCSRCLSFFDYPLQSELDEVFLPKDLEEQWDDDDERIHILQSDEIDVTAVVQENVLLNTPYVLVCHEECKGLCPTCGINLNERTCECKQEKVDPRLADLAKWFDQNDTSE